MRTTKRILAAVMIIAMVLTLMPVVRSDNVTQAAEPFEIITPANGSLVAAGYIDIKWDAPKAKEVKDYDVYINGKKVTTTTNTKYEYYTTEVAYHNAYIKVNYTDGKVARTNKIRFAVSKKGLAVSTSMGKNIKPESFGAAWYYNWGETPASNENYKDTEFVPMIWKSTSAGDFFGRVSNHKANGYKYVLTFNEPDLKGQCNMSVDDVYKSWAGIRGTVGIKVSAPVTASWPKNSTKWFQPFMSKLMPGIDHDVDFISIHCYPEDYAGAGMATWFLREVVDWTWETYQKPIWITEFSTHGEYVKADKTAEFWEAVMPELDKREYVERYSVFGYNSASHPGYGMWDYNTGVPSDAGTVYAQNGNATDDAIQYGEDEWETNEPETEEPTTEEPATEEPTSEDVTADDETCRITVPLNNSTVAAGYIDIKWNAPAGKEVRDYDVYINGKKHITTTNTKYEYYTTEVAYHNAYIIVNYKDGTVQDTDKIRFGVSKKGLAAVKKLGSNVDPNTFKVSWYYNWGENASTNEYYQNLEFVPMIWKSTSAADFYSRVSNNKGKGYKYVLTFNEPDHKQQCNMSVDDVYNSWSGIRGTVGIKVSSPVTAGSPKGSTGWFQPFMSKLIPGIDHDVDFISIHCYPENFAGARMATWFMENIVDWTWNTYHKPIWITEFSTHGDKVTADATAEFWEAVMPELDKREYVERYSVYGFNSEDHPGYGMWSYSTGTPTEAGIVYTENGNPTVDAKQYGEDETTTITPTTEEPGTVESTTEELSTEELSTGEFTTEEQPATDEPTTKEVTTAEPATKEVTTAEPATKEVTTKEPATKEVTTAEPATKEVTTEEPITENPTAAEPTTKEPLTKIAPQPGSVFAPGADEKDVEGAILSLKNENDPAGTVYSLLQLKQKKTKKKAIRIGWRKIAGAKKYVIYGNQCGKTKRYKKITAISKTDFTQKKLKKGKYYKFIVAAYDADNKLISISKIVHIVTKGGKFGNAKSVKTKAKKNKVTLKVGKKFKLKAKEVKQSGKIKKHRKIKYESDNTNVATVTSKGVIKGLSKGQCCVYAYAQNGIAKKIKVTVK